MEKIYVADREAGNFIVEVESIKQGLQIIKEYEEQDKKDKFYTPNFYDIVNEDHISLIN